jgi:membrane-associated phospholipid phosphatase
MPQYAHTVAAVPAGQIGGPTRRPGAAGALAIAGLCGLGLALTWVVADLVPAAHVRDATALREFTLFSGPQVDRPANFLLNLLDPFPFLVAGAALIAVALVRRRPRAAVAAAVVLALAPVSAEILKPLLAHPHAAVAPTHISPASWPSGHSAAALALVLGALLVAPARLRAPVAILGGLFALAVGVSLLILAWHLPSDVIGGYLIAALWGALALAGLRVADRRRAAARVPGRSGARRSRAGVVGARVPQ